MANITPQSKVALTLGTIVVCVGAIFTAGWRMASALGAIREELAAIRRDVSDIARDRWTIQDQERWAYALERSNRTINLTVPQPREVKQ